MLHFLYFWLGLSNASGSQYLFWSGFFGDITIMGGCLAYLVHIRSLNCHVKGCKRFHTFPVPGTPFRACKLHHPTLPQGDISQYHILKAHKEANQ